MLSPKTSLTAESITAINNVKRLQEICVSLLKSNQILEESNTKYKSSLSIQSQKEKRALESMNILGNIKKLEEENIKLKKALIEKESKAVLECKMNSERTIIEQKEIIAQLTEENKVLQKQLIDEQGKRSSTPKKPNYPSSSFLSCESHKLTNKISPSKIQTKHQRSQITSQSSDANDSILLASNNDDLEKGIEGIKRELHGIKLVQGTEMKQLKSQNEILQSQYREYQAHIEKIRDEHQSIINDLNLRIKKNSQSLKRLEERNAKQETEDQNIINELHNKLLSIEKISQEKENKAKELHTLMMMQKSEMKKQIDKYLEDKSRAEARIEMYEKTITENSIEMQKIKNQIENNKKQLSILESYSMESQKMVIDHKNSLSQQLEDISKSRRNPTQTSPNDNKNNVKKNKPKSEITENRHDSIAKESSNSPITPEYISPDDFFAPLMDNSSNNLSNFVDSDDDFGIQETKTPNKSIPTIISLEDFRSKKFDKPLLLQSNNTAHKKISLDDFHDSDNDPFENSNDSLKICPMIAPKKPSFDDLDEVCDDPSLVFLRHPSEDEEEKITKEKNQILSAFGENQSSEDDFFVSKTDFGIDKEENSNTVSKITNQSQISLKDSLPRRLPTPMTDDYNEEENEVDEYIPAPRSTKPDLLQMADMNSDINEIFAEEPTKYLTRKPKRSRNSHTLTMQPKQLESLISNLSKDDIASFDSSDPPPKPLKLALNPKTKMKIPTNDLFAAFDEDIDSDREKYEPGSYKPIFFDATHQYDYKRCEKSILKHNKNVANIDYGFPPKPIDTKEALAMFETLF